MKDCNGCHCQTCRWSNQGSQCRFNDFGQYTSRCYTCVHNHKYRDAQWKTESFSCRGYQKCAESKRS